MLSLYFCFVLFIFLQGGRWFLWLTSYSPSSKEDKTGPQRSSLDCRDWNTAREGTAYWLAAYECSASLVSSFLSSLSFFCNHGNENLNYSLSSSYSSENERLKKKTNDNTCWQEWWEGEHSFITGGNTNCTAIIEFNVENTLEAENWSSSRCCYTTLRHILKDSTSCYRDTCSSIFIAVLFIISRNKKEPRCPSTAEWIMKMWYIYTMGYYLTV